MVSFLNVWIIFCGPGCRSTVGYRCNKHLSIGTVCGFHFRCFRSLCLAWKAGFLFIRSFRCVSWCMGSVENVQPAHSRWAWVPTRGPIKTPAFECNPWADLRQSKQHKFTSQLTTESLFGTEFIKSRRVLTSRCVSYKSRLDCQHGK